MTLVRLLAAALVVCSAFAFAQQETDSPAPSAHAAGTSRPATATSSEPWKFMPNPPSDEAMRGDSLDRPQIDEYKVFQSKTDSRTLLLEPDADAGILLSGLDGQ